MKRLRNILKNYFLTGLLVILPIFVTVYVVWFLIRGVDIILEYIPEQYLPETYIHFQIPGIGLILVVIFIFIVGLLTRNFIGSRAIRIWEKLVHGIPLAGIIYSGVKQLLEAFFLQKNDAFKRVAMVEYPRRGIYVIGFITGQSKGEVQDKTSRKMINVFIPTTPNPTSGFYILIPEEDLVILDMSIEEAFKLVISGGIVVPPRQKVR